MTAKIFIPWLLLIFPLFGEINSLRGTVKGEDQVNPSFRDSVFQQVMTIEKERVLQRANKFLQVRPRTVTASSSPRSMGVKHDFYSEGPYWWPDSANPSGPFVRHDGLRFPGRFKDHDDDLRQFSWIVGTHTSAWILTGDKKYALAAMEHVNAWLADTTTLMNPNMLYAQAIRGVNTGRGTGIIDAVPLMDVAQSVLLLEKSSVVSGKDIEKVRQWFRQFIIWLTTHPYGIDEMNAKNNHGTWWHAQVAIYARLTGDEKILQMCRNRYREIILPGQMAPDGSYPQELARTKPYSYSLFNLDATASLTWILSDETTDVWNFRLPDGRCLWKGLEYMLPFLKDKSKWPGSKDVDHWDGQPEARQFMLFAAMAGENPEWLRLWKLLAEKNSGEDTRISQALKNPLIWVAKTGK
jgi:hypothetical protein